MSKDSASSTTLTSKKHDLVQSVLSRKRKLCDLYAVATSAEPVPETRDFRLDVHANDPLAVFLDQNDLAKGRYFRDSTIPRRQRQAASLTEIRNDARASSQQPSHATRQGTPKTGQGNRSTLSPAINDAQGRRPGEVTANEDAKGPAQSTVNTTDDGSSKSTASTSDAPNDSSKLRRSKRTGGASESDRQATPQHEPTPLDKSLRPDSPPYSPDSKINAAREDVANKPYASKAQSPVVNMPTPGKDEPDHVPNAQEIKPDNGDNPSLSESQQEGKPKADTRGRPQSSIDAADVLSSPSSSTARQSAPSPHSEARSPLTSPEDDDRPSPIPYPPEPHDLPQHKSDELPTDDPVKSQTLPKSEPAKDTKPAKEADKRASLPTAASSTSEALNKADNLNDKEQAVSQDDAQHSSAQPLQRNRTRKLLDEHGQDVSGQSSPKVPSRAMPETVAPSTTKSPKSSGASSKKKVVKHRRGQRRIVATVGNTHNNVRQRDGFKRSYSKTSRLDYFRLQIVREALNSVYGQDLHSLLSHCNIALKSTDWMLLSEEELYRIVLQRIHHLQNTTRWSLRQPAPAEEPKPEPSQWDLVVRDAKWLRSDFREERKQKIAVAYQLAKWCYDWMHSSPEDKKELQVKVKTIAPTSVHSSSDEADQTSTVPGLSKSSRDSPTDRTLADNAIDDTIEVFSAPEAALFSGRKAVIARKILNQIPRYASTGQLPTTPSKLATRASRESQAKNRSDSSQDNVVPSLKSSQSIELPPRDNSCALFWPESQATRRRLTAPFLYKPPSLPMPPQGFYEHRPASQWTWEDDQKLRSNIKEYGANWHLIAHNLSPRQEFYSNSERRTPWECYERFLALDPPQKELQTQYLKHFHFRIDKAHNSFDEQQSLFRSQAQQQASEAGRPITLPNKRFPTPMRVERKQSKRFLAMLDSARRLARKRETALSKQEKSQQSDNNSAQKSAQSQSQSQPRQNPPHSPHYFSQLKAEKDAKEFEKLQAFKEQQKALLDQQKRQQSNYQASLTNGIGQQMRNGMANNQVAANGHLAVPNANQIRANAQQAGMAMSLPNGISTQAQLAAMANRSQGGVPNQQQSQQRLTIQVNGQNTAISQENMARLMQQAAQRQQHQQMQAVRGGSPNMGNAMPNLGMLAGFTGNNSQFQNSADGVNSPNVAQQNQSNGGSNQSPHVAQALAAAAGAAQGGQNIGQSVSQTLSSGHLPQIFQIQNQIQSINPNLTDAEARQQATEQLKLFMRRNALNAASGGTDQRQPAIRGNNAQGLSQSPYPNVAQMHVYQQNGLIPSNPQQQSQGRSQSPNSLTAQQQHYQNQLRQQLFNQQRQQVANDGSATSQSPSLGQAIPNNLGNMGVGMTPMGFASSGSGTLNRASTPSSVRPASRAASGVDYGSMQPPEQQQRPGSATGVMSQGVGGSGSGS